MSWVAFLAAVRLPPLPRAELDAPDLSADRLRQRVDELDRTRTLVRGRDALHVLLESADELLSGRVAGPEHDEGLHDLAPVRVRARDDRGFDHGRMLEERALDLERTDPVA